MKVLVLTNGVLKEKEINNTLEELQNIVGGYIEIPFLSKKLNDNEIDIIINEEGKFIEGLKPEIAVIDSRTKQLLDVVFGNIIFASHNEEGDTVALNDEQMKIIKNELYLDVTLKYPNKENDFIVKALFV